MSRASLIRWSALPGIAGGALHASFMLFHPADDPAGMRGAAWLASHLTWHVAVVLALLGLVGLYAHLAERAGRFGLVSFVVAFLGTALSVGSSAIEALALPALAIEAPELVERAGTGDVPASLQSLVAVLLAAGVLFSLGYILFGLAVMRAGTLPRWAAPLLIAGAPLFTFGTAVHHLVVTAGAVLFGAGLIWLAYGLWSSTVAGATVERPAALPHPGQAVG